MKVTKVTINKINTTIQNDALIATGIEWKNVEFFQINGNEVSIFTTEPENPVVCEFCGLHTTEGKLTHHILFAHPEEQ